MNPLSKKCLTANLVNAKIDFNSCDVNDNNQKWEFGYKNMEALNNWEGYGIKFRDES